MEANKKTRLTPLPKGPEEITSSKLVDFPFYSGIFQNRILGASFLVFVVIPFLLGAFYYTFVASDKYVSSAGFAVRGVDVNVGADVLSSFTGIASNGSTASDSYILLKFLESRALIEKLEQELPFREIYANQEADYFSRLDPSLEIEEVVEYWEGRIHTSFENTSGIITFEVEAFTPEDAERVASAVLGLSEALVNELSAQARRDAVAYAESEVVLAEVRLKTTQEAMRAFRENENALDPASAARIQMELVGELEKQLSEINARIAALKGVVGVDSPSMRSLVRHSQALEQQINSQKEKAGDDNGGKALAQLLAAYESLEIEREFAQRAYESALASLETARVEAGRQQRYLAVYSRPALPQHPLYPRRSLNVFMILIGFSLLWGIGALIIFSVRDHIQ